ncbi:helicase-related protein [Pseudozobellia sp. WGM2]|uniref:helicase-related protein n=1 Tax=Pseudozobellia sp. WGM2 TaxID=2787625 RepID=UPI001ADFF113|nr:helicase-related protein [Pseudozobellia sp. WGM2]
MKQEHLTQIVALLKASNPKNYYINNSGLAKLGELLFYPASGKEEQGKQLLRTIERAFPETSKEILDSLRRYHLTSYYTPKILIEYKIGLLKQNGFEPRTILEPSAGNGAYVQELKKAFPKARITALEPDILSFEILKANNQQEDRVTVLNTTFEDFYLERGEKARFDLVMTNIPFGDIPITKAYRHDYLTEGPLRNVGNYFNFYAPKLVRPGGITALVTSSAFAERSAYNDFREYLLMENNLLLANRFNTDLFAKEGTKVVSDLLVYQRTSNKDALTMDEKAFSDTETIELEDQSLLTNRFFKNHHGNVHGTPKLGFFHNRPSIVVEPNEISLSNFLEQQSTSFEFKVGPVPSDLPEKPRTVQKMAAKEEQSVIPKTPPVVDTALPPITLHDGDAEQYSRLFFGTYNFNKKGEVLFYTDPQSTRKAPHKIKELVSDYARMRNELVLLNLNIEKRGLPEQEVTRCFQDLDYQLDTFHFKWGFLKDHLIFLKDDHYFEQVRQQFEKKVEGKGYGKNPSFTLMRFLKVSLAKAKSDETVPAETGPNLSDSKEPRFGNPEQMVRYQFDRYGQIDIAAVAKAFKTNEKELLLNGLEKRSFFLEPDMESDTGYSVVPYFLFSSGYIQDKIEYVRKHPLPFGIGTEKMEQALTVLLPAKLDLDDIEFNFESHFIPISAKESFLEDLIGEKVQINMAQFNSTLTLMFPRDFNQEAHERFSVVLHHEVKANYKRILQHFAENRYPVIFTSYKDRSGKTIRKLDKDATLMAQNLYEELQLHFKSFIEGRQELKATIENNYYQAFLADVNITVPKGWLTFPDTLVYPPYQHQIDSTLFGLTTGSALNDHQVGKGKTLSMAMLAHKLKQHGKSRRTLLLTLKSVAPQIETEIRANFPQLNILRLSSRNMAKGKRAKTLKTIKNHGAIDLIIAEHGHLKQIPKSRRFVLDILGEKIDMIEQDLETAREYGNIKESKKLIKGLIKRKEHLEDKLQTTLKKLEERSEETETTLAELGIEALIIDEAHYFKNIGFTTRHQNVSGLNNHSDSQRNLDLEISIKSIHHRRGPDKNIFFYSGTPLKNSVTELYAYQRYLTPAALKRKSIFNFDAWASIFLKQSVSIEPNIFGDPRMHARFRYYTNLPELSKMYNSFTHICRDKHFRTHNLEVDREFIILESTPAYEELKRASLRFTKDRNQNALFKVPVYNADQMKSAHITALNINRSLLIDPLAKDNLAIDFSELDQFKLQRLCRDVVGLYKKTSEHKGVCLVFSDLNVWKPGQYNSYDTVREILREDYGIPAHEIALAQEEKARNRTDRMQEKIRNGEIRVALGSTQVLGTGTNIQKRVVGIFHMDIPYSPDAFDQRAGRGLRKGNEVAQVYGNTVVERFYGIKDSTDIFSYSLNTHKERFREQIREADPNKRIYDDLVPDDKSLSYEQMQAALIGDMDQFQLVKLSDDLKFLQSQKRLHELNKANSFKAIERIEKENKHIVSQVAELENAHRTIEKLNLPLDETESEELDRIQQGLLGLVSGSELESRVHNIKEPKTFLKRLGLAIAERSNLNLNIQKHKQVARLPTLNANLVFQAEYVPSNGNYLYSYGLQFRNIHIASRKQQRFDPEKVALQLIKLCQKVQREIRSKKFDLDHNLRSLEAHKKKTAIGFPREKTAKMSVLKQDIKALKRKRAG